MALTLEQAQKALTCALKDKKHKVVALSGAWGAGKTHLWRTVAPELGIGTIEITAFGAKSILDLKTRLLQSRLDTLKKGVGAAAHEGLSAAKGMLKKFTGVELGDPALLALPSFTRGRLVLIDDIERKQKSFETDELLGFINEFSEKYETRFLLILNSDQLGADSSWHTLREKVIDVELNLAPSPQEAFDIASAGAERTDYLHQARAAVADLNIVNIRILKKVATALGDLLARQASLPQPLLQRTIPTMILMITAHYRGHPSGITLDYIESFSWGAKEEPSETLAWKQLLQTINFHRDDLIRFIADYLRSGIVAQDELAAYFAPRIHSASKSLRTQAISEFLKDAKWLQTFSIDHLLDFYKTMDSHFYDADAYDITAIHRVFSEEGEHDSADTLLRQWIEAARNAPNGEDRLPRGAPPQVHPDICALEGTLASTTSPAMPLLQALEQVRDHTSATSREALSIMAADEQKYLELFPTLDRDQLESFIKFHASFASSQQTPLLAHAHRNFINAIRVLSSQNTHQRLVRIVKREFARFEVVLNLED